MTLAVVADLDVSPWVDFLVDLERQLPFAAAKGINETAKEIQAAETKHLFREFEIRRPLFAQRATKIKPFATKKLPEATISIDPPGGQARADIWTKFEESGWKRPSGRSIAIPDEATRTSKGILSRSARPRAFDFKLVATRSDGTKIYKGRRRTFMIQHADGTGGIYQRVGTRGTKRRRGAGRRMASSISTRRVRDLNVRTLFRFTPQARIEERLDFYETADKIVRARFSKNLEDAIALAIRTSGSTTASKQQRRIARADVLGRDRRS
jgi:hypothetical protein